MADKVFKPLPQKKEFDPTTLVRDVRVVTVADKAFEPETLWWTFGPLPQKKEFDPVTLARHVKALFETLGYSIIGDEVRVETTYTLEEDAYYVSARLHAINYPGLNIQMGITEFRLKEVGDG